MIYQMSLTSLNQYYLLAILPSSIQTPMHHTISNIVNNKLKQTGCGWMSTNKLNIEKTYYIVFGSKLSNEIHLQIDNVNITIKNDEKVPWPIHKQETKFEHSHTVHRQSLKLLVYSQKSHIIFPTLLSFHYTIP